MRVTASWQTSTSSKRAIVKRIATSGRVCEGVARLHSPSALEVGCKGRHARPLSQGAAWVQSLPQPASLGSVTCSYETAVWTPLHCPSGALRAHSRRLRCGASVPAPAAEVEQPAGGTVIATAVTVSSDYKLDKQLVSGPRRHKGRVVRPNTSIQENHYTAQSCRTLRARARCQTSSHTHTLPSANK